MKRIFLLTCCIISLFTKAQTNTDSLHSGNPLFPGWYADPEGTIFKNQYWIYPTYSTPYNKQVFFDAFSSPDLVHWTKHPHILDTVAVKWTKRAMWAPSVVEQHGRYYFFFGANDLVLVIHNTGAHLCIGISTPAGTQ